LRAAAAPRPDGLLHTSAEGTPAPPIPRRPDRGMVGDTTDPVLRQRRKASGGRNGRVARDAESCSTPWPVHINRESGRTAVIIGASSGIGEALAHELNRDGWRLGLLARRRDRLEALRQTLQPDTVVRRIDVTQDDAATILDDVFDELGDVDLVIISAGAGHNNRDLNEALDDDTVAVNVLGFLKAAQVAVRYFLKRGHGHLVGISSIAALRATVLGPPTRRRKPFSRCTSMACEIWRGNADFQ